MDLQKAFASGGLTMNYNSPTSGLQQGPGLGYYGSQDVYTPPAPAQTQQQPKQSSSPPPAFNASTAGITERDAWARANGYTGWNNYLDNQRAQQGPSQVDVDNAWSPVLQNYDTIKANTLAGEQNFYNSQTSGFDAMKPGLTQSYNEANALNQQQGRETEMSGMNAISSARKLFNDLTTGNKQRFGGASSAGEFANEIQGRSFQEQMGNIRNTIGQNMQKVMEQGQNILKQYQAKTQELDMLKENALQKAREFFQNKISEIDMAKGAAIQNKAVSKLQELQNFRSLAMQIQQNAETQRQALEAEARGIYNNFQNSLVQYQMSNKTPVSQISMPNYAYPQFGGGQEQQTSNISGFYDPNKRYTT